MQLMKIAVPAAALLVALVGCTSPGGEVTPTDGRPSFQTMAPIDSSGTPIQASEAQLKSITADLAGRGITGDITVVKAISITWTDGALGCPEAGRAYTQALEPGYQIIVSVGGTQYDYHFGKTETPKLCEAK